MKRNKLKYDSDKNERYWKGYYIVTGFLGLVSLIFEILLYRKTIISPFIPIAITLTVGLIAFYFNKNHYKKIYFLHGNFFPLMQNLTFWGLISCFTFMATNYYLAEKTTNEYRFKIKEKGSVPGSKQNRKKRKPLIKIDYFNFKKELVFNFEDTQKVNKADSVIVIVRKGGLGFDIIQEYDVFY